MSCSADARSDGSDTRRRASRSSPSTSRGRSRCSADDGPARAHRRPRHPRPHPDPVRLPRPVRAQRRRGDRRVSARLLARQLLGQRRRSQRVRDDDRVPGGVLVSRRLWMDNAMSGIAMVFLAACVKGIAIVGALAAYLLDRSACRSALRRSLLAEALLAAALTPAGLRRRALGAARPRRRLRWRPTLLTRSRARSPPQLRRRLGVRDRGRSSSSFALTSVRLWHLQVSDGRRVSVALRAQPHPPEARAARPAASSSTATARSWSTTARRSTSCSCPRTRRRAARRSRRSRGYLGAEAGDLAGAVARGLEPAAVRGRVLQRDLDWESVVALETHQIELPGRLAAGRAAPHLPVRPRSRRISSATSAR